MRTNNKQSRLICTLAAICVAAIPTACLASKAGFAERDVTPEIGMEQPGGYHKVYHRSVHDPCKVRAAVFDDGKKCVAVVGVDALTLSRELVVDCRDAIRQRCGIAPEAVMIAASHSHSSGPTGMVQPGEYDHASDMVKKFAYEESSAANPEYLKTIERAVVDAVNEAYEGRVDVLCGFGVGEESKAAFNRRFRMKNGLTYTHPGQGNPNIVKPAGPIDPDVGVIAAWNTDGRMLGCIVNFSCHATTSPGGISANYIYYLEQVIQGTMGDQAVVVFTAGASGDITQVDNLARYSNPKSEQWSRFVGGRVGAEAVKVMVSIERTASFKVDAAAKVLRIPRRAPSDQHIQEALALVKKPRNEVDNTQYTFAKETLMLSAKLKAKPIEDVEVQAIQIGPAVFTGNPSEYFCQYGLDIKAGSSFPLTFPVSLANGCIGYVPTEEALGAHGGGYETRLTSYSNLIPTAGTTIANECIALTKTLEPGVIPTRPPHAAFRGDGWSYGNVAPQVD